MEKIKIIKIIWYENSLFFYLITALLVIGVFPLFVWDKVAFFILLKQWHHPMLDCIAPYFTWLGDGITYLSLLCIVTLLHATCRKTMVIGGSFVMMTIVVQLLKRLFFRDQLRPIALLPVDVSLHLVDGVSLPTDFSFPSGHAATIFSLISVLQLLSSSKNFFYSLILLGIALMVVYSRIYLCQHFYTDVYVGAWIGTIAAVVTCIYVMDYNGPSWLDRSIYFLLYPHGKRFPIKK
ncbi:phosphatase PAP2 family protein [Cardinium endosymbiont of Bemisia tabaci]|uniref:phosphatase PAP2 family protein n=1 Tax=Cardinium endosymbiont of Bemisia tabaci TaxID=672794 RepID=UPI000442D2DB|nr:phosphatase PAP2 family protein [Cardinium endosymbiont of Bemisia tabaci]CDG49519.1 PA-phosphatase-like phosphoesterase [Cardinium endosymbiont cBtQ1 of Bemisia tabaci]